MIEQLFSDMDGTILGLDGRISSITAQAVKEIGLPLSLVSARSPMEMVEAIQVLGQGGIHVAFNGGCIFRINQAGMEILYDLPLDRPFTQAMTLDIRLHFPNISLNLFTATHWYLDREDEYSAYEQALTRIPYQLVDYQDFFEEDTGPFYKIMLVTFDPDVMEQLKAYLEGHPALGSVSVYQTHPFYLELTPKGAQKSKGVQYIQDLRGLRQDQLMAFGDGPNDVPMLEVVGQAVVMANASPSVKRYADYITLSHEEDGVAYALKHYLPILQESPRETEDWKKGERLSQ